MQPGNALKVLVFGNPYLDIDNIALKIADILRTDKDMLSLRIEFENCYDLRQVIDQDSFMILDAVKGIPKPQLIATDELEAGNILSLHDFDLGFFLKLKKELGRLDVKIIGVPQEYELKKAIEEVKVLLREIV